MENKGETNQFLQILENLEILVGAEIGEGDERRKFQFLESGNSLNGRNLFIELPSCRIPYQRPHSLNAWIPFSEMALLLTDFCLVASPSQNSVPI